MKRFLPVLFLLVGSLALHANTSFTLCPGDASQNGAGSFGFSSAPSGGACSTSVTMSITNATDYARFLWNSSSTGYPSGLQLGQLLDLNANVTVSGSDNPFYMLVFTDSTGGLGQTNASDQILLLQFQSSTVSGNSMPFSNTTSLFNLYDNTTGVYLQGGQSHTNTVAGWISMYPFLGNESLDQIRIGMGLGGGSGPGGSVTLDSVTGNTNVPEPGSAMLLASGLVGMAGLVRRKLAR